MADDAHSPKLSDVWGFVLLRGIIEGGLLLLFFVQALQEIGPMAFFIAVLLLGGSLVELTMASYLKGHAFRGILIFTGLTGLMIAIFILYNYLFSEAVVTLTLLVVMMGLWAAVRGFAALWLGLSIVSSGLFERSVPVVAGLLGLGVGFAALLFFSPESEVAFVRLVSLYGLGSIIVHLMVAFRMRQDRRRLKRQAQEETNREV